MLATFKDFLLDEEAEDMYVTGAAGTGKTHGLAKVVEYCVTADIEYIVCAHTHKACGVLRQALPAGAHVATLHSYLKKRPTINAEAVREKHVEVSRQHGTAAKTSVLIVDEYSIIGEKDLMSIRDLNPTPKIVWLGDPHQLPPVARSPPTHPPDQR